MPNRANILRSYRELLYLIKRFPNEKKAEVLQEARSKVHANKGETNELKASDMHKELVGRIGYLRMTQPRQRGDRYAKAGQFVLRDGVLVEDTPEKEKRVADGKVSMDEAHRKHNQLLRRQHFGRDPPPIREPF